MIDCNWYLYINVRQVPPNIFFFRRKRFYYHIASMEAIYVYVLNYSTKESNDKTKQINYSANVYATIPLT